MANAFIKGALVFILEYLELELGHGNNQSQRTQDHSGDAAEDGGAVTTAATQAAVNAVKPDIFQQGFWFQQGGPQFRDRVR
jgi:hypothetical protein